MNEVQVLIDRCRKANGNQVSLRSLWPGRGKAVTERRAKVKTLFGDKQEVKEDKIIDGETVSEVVATIVYDKQRGVYHS